MRQIDLQEYQPSTPLELSFGERNALRNVIPGLSTTETDDRRWVLTPSSTVGAIEVGELSVRIKPKIGIRQLLSLACYATGALPEEIREFGFAEDEALPDVLALALVREARRAFSRGLLHGYIEREEALFTVRGRIRFDEQLRRRPGMLLPIEVRYDEFTDDILANRLVKAAAYRLGRMRLRSQEARRGLRWVTGMLDNVSLREWRPGDVPEVKFDRLNEHYRGVVALSRLVLRHGEFEARRGEIRASGFLMDMNKVFQEFVTVALREKLGVAADKFGSISSVLNEPTDKRQVHLYPDLAWRDGGKYVFVGDAKYKKLTGEHIPNADLYQLLAYVTALKLPAGLLIYAKGERDPASYTVRNADKQLDVKALDLSGSLDDVLEDVGRLADKVRELRAAALGQSALSAPAGHLPLRGRQGGEIPAFAGMTDGRALRARFFAALRMTGVGRE